MTQDIRGVLKLALEALENSVDLVVEDAYNAEQLYGNYPTRQGKVGGLKILADQHKEAITAIKEALAQPEQEPVAYLTRRKIGGTEGLLRADLVDKSAKNQETHDFIPLYTAPPQRTWQGLTDEDISEIVRGTHNTGSFVRAIESKLKERNT